MCSLGLLTFVLIWKCGGSFRLVRCWKPLGPPALRSSSITYGAVLHPMTISRYSPKRRCALCRGQSHSASACSLKIASNSHSSQREWSRCCPMSSILAVLWPLGGLGLLQWQGSEASSSGKTAQTWKMAEQNKSACAQEEQEMLALWKGINYSLGSSQVTLWTVSAKPPVIVKYKVIKQGVWLLMLSKFFKRQPMHLLWGLAHLGSSHCSCIFSLLSFHVRADYVVFGLLSSVF